MRPERGKSTRMEGVHEAYERLRAELAEHDRSGEPETPFSAGIREILGERDAHREQSADSAA
jgi:hypothetical protein